MPQIQPPIGSGSGKGATCRLPFERAAPKVPPMNKTAPQSAPVWPAEIAKLSFEEAMVELEKLVRQLEDGKAKLEDAIGAYERGALLKRYCETKLREAEVRIEQISVSENGEASTTPFNV